MVRLLIVDDNADMRRLIGSIVKKPSDSVYECDDGSLAINAYREHHPDWVLMDVDMPVKDGLTATREICAEFPTARIVMVTKHNDATTREAAAQAGACEYVLKENLLDLRRILTPVTVERAPRNS